MKPMPDRLYDIIKWFALLVIPSFVGALVAIQEIWSVPIDNNIIGGLTGFSAIIGAMLTLSSMAYYTKNGSQFPPVPMPVRVYKILQDMTLYWLPAAATAYYLASLVMNVHYAAPVVETAVVIQVFLGLILGTYSSQTGDLKFWVQKLLAELMDRAKGVGGGSTRS